MTIYHSSNARFAPEADLFGAEADRSGPFTIVHICVANQCRSPMAERITRHELSRQLGPEDPLWRSTSAGTKATDGTPMHDLSRRTLETMGIDADNFQARRLTATIAIEADLVLAATTIERDRVIALAPSTLPTAFSLLEFARLVAAVPADAVAADGESSTAVARAVVAEARKLRGRVRYVNPDDDDVVDPPRTATAFERCAADIDRAVRTILVALTRSVAPVAP